MLSHTFFTVGRRKASLIEAIFNCIKWTLRFFDKLEMASLIQGGTLLSQQLIPNGRISLPPAHLCGGHTKSTQKLFCDSLPRYGAGLGCSGPARQPKPREDSSTECNHNHAWPARSMGPCFPPLPPACQSLCPNLGWCPNGSDMRQGLVQMQPQA